MSILVGTDFSENTLPALLTAANLANQLKTTLRVMHVVDFSGDDNAWRVLYETTDEIEKSTRLEAETQLKDLIDEVLPEETRPEVQFSVRFGTPAGGIIEECGEDRPDLIVVGTIGHSRLQHLFFGRTASHLIRETEVPVLAIPPDSDTRSFAKIVVAIDFSTCSRVALQLAARVAGAFESKLECLHAVDIDHELSEIPFGHILGDVRPRVDDLLNRRASDLREFVEAAGLTDAVSEYHLTGARPDIAIKTLAKDSDFDLIVMGTHGRQGFARWFLGSTAERVLRSPPRPVLVVSAPEPE